MLLLWHGEHWAPRQRLELISRTTNVCLALEGLHEEITKTAKGTYQASVISVLLVPYGSECWRMTAPELKKLQSFHTSCLWKIMYIFWPRKISNNELFKLTETWVLFLHGVPRQTWIGHLLHGESTKAGADTGGVDRVDIHPPFFSKKNNSKCHFIWNRK